MMAGDRTSAARALATTARAALRRGEQPRRGAHGPSFPCSEQILLVVIIVAGIFVGLHLRKNRPEAYRRIGNHAGDHHDVRRATGQLPTVTKQQ